MTVSQVVPAGPAARAGMQPGDVLISVEGQPVPPGTKVPEVAERIRGKPGRSCRIEVRRAGVPMPLVVDVERAAMDRLFPPQSRELVAVRPGLALLASGMRFHLGIRFTSGAKAGEPLAYEWRATDAPGPLGAAGVRTGQGMVSVDPGQGGVVQVLDWKLDLKALPEDGGVFVAASNLPVHLPQGDWLAVAPPWPGLVRPRAQPPKQAVVWEGPARLLLVAQAAGQPVAQRRVTLRLTDGRGITHDSRTVTSDAAGRFEVPVPAGEYLIGGLQPSVAGRGRDAYFEFGLTGAAVSARTDGETAVTLNLDRPTKAAGQIDDWAQDERVGLGLPPLDVQRWFGLEGKPPPTLAGRAMLVYVWATWCGPCRATAPMVAEVHARLAARGLVTVAASIDRDEAALETYAEHRLPGAPPIAWIGPEAMADLELDSVPTFIVLDAKGRVRGLHRGTGWTVDALEAWLGRLLDEARTAGR